MKISWAPTETLLPEVNRPVMVLYTPKKMQPAIYDGSVWRRPGGLVLGWPKYWTYIKMIVDQMLKKGGGK